MSPISLSAFDNGCFFTSDFPDVRVSVALGGVRCVIQIVCDGEEVYHERLWGVNGFVTLTELGEFLSPFVQRHLQSTVSIECYSESSTGEAVDGSAESSTGTVLFSRCDVGVSAETFLSDHFLTVLDGTRQTSMGRLEQLWYYGDTDIASVVAEYSDGTTYTFPRAVMLTGNEYYSCVDASPCHYAEPSGWDAPEDGSVRRLVRYTVCAGSRRQVYEVLERDADCAPILEFYNSFGVWEHLYCMGTHRVDPSYKRSSVRVGRLLKNYRIDETRLFKADTGVLSFAMSCWADELFRSPEVYVVNVVDGAVVDRDGGKEVVITDSKSEMSNDDASLPRFTFSYVYAQRIHNVLQPGRVGRVFDNTFDHTFN